MRCVEADSRVILRVARVRSPLVNLIGEGILIVVKLWVRRTRREDWSLIVNSERNSRISRSTAQLGLGLMP